MKLKMKIYITKMAYLGNEKVIELLTAHGANLGALNLENETALHWAALNCKS